MSSFFSRATPPQHGRRSERKHLVHDNLNNNRPHKMLTVVDEYTRQALAVHVAHKMSAADVLEALYTLLIKHGKPQYIRSDNGPESVADVF
jgi:putative transposase